MTAKPFTTRLEASLKPRLDAIADREDRSASYLAKKAISDFVERREQDFNLVKQARAQLEAGEGIAEENVDAWMQSWANGKDKPFLKEFLNFRFN